MMGLRESYMYVSRSGKTDKFIDQFKVLLLEKKRCWVIKKSNECGLICNYLKVFNWKLYP